MSFHRTASVALLVLVLCGCKSSYHPDEVTWSWGWVNDNSKLASASALSAQDGYDGLDFSDSTVYREDPYWTTGVALTWKLGPASANAATTPAANPMPELGFLRSELHKTNTRLHNMDLHLKSVDGVVDGLLEEDEGGVDLWVTLLAVASLLGLLGLLIWVYWPRRKT